MKTKEVLAPFATSRRVLEGDTYVTRCMVLVTVESIAANLDDLSEAPDVTCDVNRTLMCLKGDHISRWRWNEENK